MRLDRHRSHPSSDRWLISYADFITLLFAFFVVMYAVAQSDRSKVKTFSESVKRAMEGSTADRISPVSARKPANLPDDLNQAYERLRTQLRQEIAGGGMQVTLESRGVVISLREKAFFSSGTDLIYPAAVRSLGEVAAVLRDLPNAVRLEGHTDSVPIHNERFRSNWDLSAARSIAVLAMLEERYGIPAQRFAVSGWADNQPIADNDSDEGRARNRRVDIVILGQTR